MKTRYFCKQVLDIYWYYGQMDSQVCRKEQLDFLNHVFFRFKVKLYVEKRVLITFHKRKSVAHITVKSRDILLRVYGGWSLIVDFFNASEHIVQLLFCLRGHACWWYSWYSWRNEIKTQSKLYGKIDHENYYNSPSPSVSASTHFISLFSKFHLH